MPKTQDKRNESDQFIDWVRSSIIAKRTNVAFRFHGPDYVAQVIIANQYLLLQRLNFEVNFFETEARIHVLYKTKIVWTQKH